MMEVWSMTDVGLVRKENQDACAVCQHEESGHTSVWSATAWAAQPAESWPAALPWIPL